MGKLASIELYGDLAQGVWVTLEIGLEGAIPLVKIQGQLPTAPELDIEYENWRSNYRSIGIFTRIKPGKIYIDGSINERREDCRKSADVLRLRFNNWLQSDSFRPIREKWLEQLVPSDEVRVLIRTPLMQLKQLPWHSWDLLERYPLAEIALSASESEKFSNSPKNTSKKQVRILAILGDSTNIDIQKDRQLLEKLPDTSITFLIERKRQQINDYLWDKPWDILFFAGHSNTEGEQGRIYINDTDSLTIDELRYSLKKAIKNGLQLAIFNSCDGLGLARELEKLHIPQMIIMREPVPDRVAQEFLKHFLTAFAGGQSLYLAVREARERLQGLEDEFPNATWLPVICQHPAFVPPTWNKLRNRNKKNIVFIGSFSSVLITSILVTVLIMVVRSLGTLEPWELFAYDRLIQLRPSQPIDERILVVEADSDDTAKYGKPLLSDGIIAQVLDKLEQYQPRAIGVDIFRPKPLPPGHNELINNFKNNPNIIISFFIGKVSAKNISPPIEFSEKQLKEQAGFTDSYPDENDDTVRLQILSLGFNSNSYFDFSLLLANQYLKANGKKLDIKNGVWQIGTTTFKQLENKTGGYQQLGGKSTEILLNFRSPPKNSQIAKSIKLRDVLGGHIDPKYIKDKIVLIGITDPNPPFQDEHKTPYGVMRGLWLNAQMVSAILSAVEDGQKLWVLPQWGDIQWGDALFVWVWSFAGSLLAWRIRSRQYLGLASLAATWFLYKICLVTLISGGWMPLIPSLLSLFATEGFVIIYTPYRFLQKQE